MAVLAIVLLGQSIRATTVDPPDFATLVKDADVIFRGQVTNIRSEWAGEGRERHIVSYVTFEVLKSLKGNPSSPFILQMLGGTVGTETFEIVGAPKFKTGDRSLLFVEKNGTQFVPLVGIMHGHFRITQDPASGEEILLKHDGVPLTGSDEIDQMHARGPVDDHDGPKGARAGAADSKTGRKPMKRKDFEDQIVRQTAITKP